MTAWRTKTCSRGSCSRFSRIQHRLSAISYVRRFGSDHIFDQLRGRKIPINDVNEKLISKRKQKKDPKNFNSLCQVHPIQSPNSELPTPFGRIDINLAINFWRNAPEPKRQNERAQTTHKNRGKKNRSAPPGSRNSGKRAPKKHKKRGKRETSLF